METLKMLKKYGGLYISYLFYFSIMERKATNHQFVFLLSLHWNGTVVVQFKNLPVEIRSIYFFYTVKTP